MAGPKVLPLGTSLWRQSVDHLKPTDIQKLYESGMAGAYGEPQEQEMFRDEIKAAGGDYVGANVSHQYGLADSAAGQLVVPFVYAQKLYPNCMPGPAQARGDCVSHDTKNAALITLVCEIIAAQALGTVDEVTGKLEGKPEVSPEGEKGGVLSPEAIYWWRRHGGDGWSCPAAARVICNESGLWLRQNYPELGVDLTNYSGKNAGLYGSRTPPEKFLTLGKQHLVRTAAELGSFEEVRDFLANGYGVSTCGSEGYSNSRDENGVSVQQGRWAHAMALIGADDRDVIKAIYREPLVLVLNSWGIWNKGPRRIKGTTIDIPEGSFWARWSHVKNRYMVAFSSVNGWPARRLPSLGATGRV